MTITDDKIIFDTADFDGLSDFAKKAVTSFALNSVPSLDGKFEVVFSDLLSRYVADAKTHLKSVAQADPVTDSILAGLASASEEKLLEAKSLLTQLDDLLKTP